MTDADPAARAHADEPVRALAAVRRREQWLQATVPFPAFAALLAARAGAGLGTMVGCAAVLVALLVAYVAASRERRALEQQLAETAGAGLRAEPGRAAGGSPARTRRVVFAGVAVAFAALAATLVRSRRDRHRVAERPVAALAADSIEEHRADSVIAVAVRAQPKFDVLRAALTPAAYAHDTAFAGSLLAEEHALVSPECRSVASPAPTADELPPVDPDLAACVEAVLRRDWPVVTRADSVRDSVRLAVRQRFRRGARAMVDAALAERHGGAGHVTDEMRTIGHDPGPDGPFPGEFDAFGDVYRLPSPGSPGRS